MPDENRGQFEIQVPCRIFLFEFFLLISTEFHRKKIIPLMNRINKPLTVRFQIIPIWNALTHKTTIHNNTQLHATFSLATQHVESFKTCRREGVCVYTSTRMILSNNIMHKLPSSHPI